MGEEVKNSVEHCLSQFREAFEAKTKLVDREKEDFLYALGKQWSDEDLRALELAKVKPATDNRIAPNLYLLTGLERQNRSDFKAFPEGEEDSLKSEIASALFKKAIQRSDYGYKSSDQFKDGITCGESHLELYLDHTENLLNGKPNWKKMDGGQVFPDPASREYDMSDARYVFKVTFDISKEDVVSIYPEKEDDINEISNGKIDLETMGDGSTAHKQPKDYPSKSGMGGDRQDVGGDVLDLIEKYYKKWVTTWYLGDYKTGRVSQVESKEKAEQFIQDYQASIEQNKINYQMALAQGQMAGAAIAPPPPPDEDVNRYRPIKRSVPEMWMVAFVPGMNEVLSDARAWFYPKWKKYPIISYYSRFSTAPLNGDDRHLLIQGLVHGVKNAQDRHNKASTLTLRHLNSSTNSGWIAEDGAWVDEDEVKAFGTNPGVNLYYKKGKPKPERITPSPLSAGHLQMANEAAEDMKQALGINSDLLATQQGGADSGRAIALRQKQGLLMVQEIYDNLSRSRINAGKFMLSQLGQMYDTETAKKVLGEAWLKKNFPPLLMMNPETNQQEPMKDAKGDPMEYDNEMAELAIAEVLSGDLGEYDVTVGEAVNGDTLKMMQAQELKEFAAAFPGIITPDVLIEESSLPKNTKDRILGQIKQAQAAQAQMVAPGQATQGGPNGMA